MVTTIGITDSVTKGIVARYQKEIGERTATGAACRIIAEWDSLRRAGLLNGERPASHPARTRKTPEASAIRDTPDDTPATEDQSGAGQDSTADLAATENRRTRRGNATSPD